MSDPVNTNPEPPLVLRAEPLAPAPRKPRPGLGESLLWCLAFWIVLIVGVLTVTGGVLTAFGLASGDEPRFYKDQLFGFVDAVRPPAPNQPLPPMLREIGQSLAYGMVAAQLASLGFVLLVVPRRVGPDWKRQLGFRSPAALHVLLVLLIVPALILLAQGFQELVVQLTGASATSGEAILRGTFQQVPWVATLFAVAIGPGLVEELWCRGFLGRGLCARYGLKWGVVLTSLIFAALHGDVLQFMVFALMGAYLHFVYLASRSLWVPILLHMLNNGAVTVMALTPDLYDWWSRLLENQNGFRAVAEIASLAVLIFGSVAFWTSRAEVIGLPQEWDEEEWKPEYPGISAPPPGVPAKLAYGKESLAAMVLTLISFGVLLYVLSRW